MRAVIPNPDQTQRPGQFVTAKVTLVDKHEVVLIPAQAVAQNEGGHYVYVVDKDNMVQQQGVTVGSEYEASYVIEKGVKPGDRVVVTGLQKVHGGAQVEVVKSGDKTSVDSKSSEQTDTNKTQAAKSDAGDNDVAPKDNETKDSQG